MSENSMLKCLIAFILGFLVQYMMRIDGLVIGGGLWRRLFIGIHKL